MTTQIQLRRGAAAQWTSVNPTLAEGEVGLETDTGRFKFGDGSTAWNALGYTSDLSDIDTLVKLNTVVTDATLDDAGDPRDPNTHAGTHATAGSDPVAPSDIGAEPAGTAASEVSAHEAAADPHSGAYATSAQGALADTAVQPGDDAATLGSGAATDGWVLTADGAGGAAFEEAAGGGGGLTDAQQAALDLVRLDFGDTLTGTGSLSASWTERIGTWTVTADGAHPATNVDSVAIATVAQTGQIDIEAACYMTSNNNFATGLVALYVDDENYVYVQVNTTTLSIREVVAGVETTLAQSDNSMRTASRMNRLHVSVVSNNRVHAYVGHRPETVPSAAVTSSLVSGTVGCGIFARGTLSAQLIQSFAVRGTA